MHVVVDLVFPKKRVDSNLALAKSRLGTGIKRHDILLIEVVEELGPEAGRQYSNLQIEIIPDEYKDCYQIKSYDGNEEVVCDLSKLI